MIVEVALYHAPQPFPDFRQRVMHARPKLVLYLFQLGKESLSDTFAQHEELAVLPGLPTDGGEAQKVERLRLAFPVKKLERLEIAELRVLHRLFFEWASPT